MQITVTSHAPVGAVRTTFGRVFAAIGLGIDAFVEALSRAREVERLEAMSDRQLARLGIARNEIVEHVFRDRTRT